VAAVFALSAAAQSRYPITLFGHGSGDGLMYQFEVPAERVEKLPGWNPSDRPPPLPISTAVTTGETWIKARNPEIKQFELGAVTLSRVTWPSEFADRWYYRIEFNPIVAGQRLYGGQFTAVILFDGSVVEPRLEKRTPVK
jgi:hypothetical protein